MRVHNVSIPSDPDSLLSYRQAAALLGVSERTIWSVAQAGEIPIIRIGRCVRFRRAAVIDWIRQREVVRQ